MKASGKRILAVIAALNLYGLLSALFNAWTTGLTVDESTFQLAGREFLAHRDPTVLIDHPPMAMWLGALYPWFSGDFSAFAYRIGHVVLFFSAGVYISTRLWKSAGVWAALVFSVIYNLDPFMKAMASLHVTDGDVLAWVGMAGVSVWSSRQRSNETPVRSLLLGGFFYGLAIVTKISALFYAPVLLLALLWGDPRRKWRGIGRVALPASVALMVLCGVALGYLFNFRAIHYLAHTFQFSMQHNHRGHVMAFLGHFTVTGFWYYHLLLFLFKTPIPILLALGFSFYVFGQQLREDRRAGLTLFVTLLGPGIFLFVLMSHANAQAGYRYILPGMILIDIAAAILLGRVFHEHPRAVIWIFVSLLLAIDVSALARSSYLPYANVLSPKSTRNLSENVDWGQGIPRHLSDRIGVVLSASDIFQFLEKTNDEPGRFLIGTSELAGYWRSFFAPHFRAFERERTLAGYEIISVTKNDLFLLMTAKRPFRPTWDFGALNEASVPISAIRHLEKSCKAPARLQTYARELLPKGVKIDPQSISKTALATETKIQLEPAVDYVILLRSNVGAELFANGRQVIEPMDPMGPPYEEYQWGSFKPMGAGNELKIRYQPFPRWGYFSALLLWQECH